MTARNKVILGLQWGGCAWLAYLAAKMLKSLVELTILLPLGVEIPWAARWGAIYQGHLHAASWLVALALIAAGSRWARPAMVATLAWHFALNWGWGWGWIPMCVPLLPLVVWRVEEPRVVLAMLALGRWREAAARSGGVMVVAVAVATVATNRVLLAF